MQIKKFDNEDEWLSARRTKITGTRLNDIYSVRGTVKKGFYELIAERLAIDRPAGEDKMARGHELEPEAISMCEKELGKTFNKELVMWERDDNPSIAISPDAYLEDLIEAIEVKCLSSADHIKAVIDNEPPKDYEHQILQYFIVNDALQILHFVMYDPSLTVKQYVRFEIKREDIKDDIKKFLKFEREQLDEVKKIVNKLSF